MLDPRVSAKPFLYTYDTRASVVAQLAMPTGQTIAYARDAQGRLLSTTLSGTARPPRTVHAHGSRSRPHLRRDFHLVHMNGRIYDPLLGRFLSADLIVQAPGNLQSFNRYSYVLNNPLTFVDPSGFAVDINIINPKDPNYAIARRMPGGQSGLTTMAFHGLTGGNGFTSNKIEFRDSMLSYSDIQEYVGEFGEMDSDGMIVAYVCFGGAGGNLVEMKKLSIEFNTPILAATDAVAPAFKGKDGPYDHAVVKNDGYWVLISPDGSVRRYADVSGATKAEKRATNAANKANTSYAQAQVKTNIAKKKLEDAKTDEARASAQRAYDAAKKKEEKAQRKADDSAAEAAAAKAAKERAEEEAKRLKKI